MSRTRWVAGVTAAMLAACSPAFEFGPSQIVVSDSQAFVRDALALIEKLTVAAAEDHQWIDEEHLPSGLRIQKIVLPRFAFLASVLEAHVASDHLDLVLIRHTDGHAGARVWAAKSRPHRDTPTTYKDIYFFSYDEERPESPENIP